MLKLVKTSLRSTMIKWFGIDADIHRDVELNPDAVVEEFSRRYPRTPGFC